MPKLLIPPATTSKLIDVFVPDSSSTVGAGLTGLVFNTASLVAYYYREGAAAAVKIDSGGATALVTMTLGTWVSCGFIAIDGTNMPGWYQLGVPDAALIAGANSVSIVLRGATNMGPCNVEIQLSNVPADMRAISEDATAADNFETMLDGTGGNKLTLEQLRINSSSAGGALDIDNSGGPGIAATSGGGNGGGMELQGNGSGHGMQSIGGATGHGFRAVGGATSGSGILANASASGQGISASGAGTGSGMLLTGIGAAAGFDSTGGATGHGMRLVGGATSGDGLNAAATTSGDGISATGIGTGDGIEATKGASGTDIDADIAGTITTATSVTNGVTLADDAITAAKIATGAIDDDALATTGLTAIAAAVWNALTSGMTAVGSIGKKLADWTILTSQAIADALKLAPTVGAPAAGSVNADLDTLTTGVNVTTIESVDATDAINAAVDDALNTAIPGSPVADSINERVKAVDDLTQALGGGDLAALWTRIQAVSDADSVLLDSVQRLAIVSAWAARTPAQEEAAAGAGSFASIMGLLGQKHKVTVVDNGDGTSTLTCYKSDAATTWFTATLTNVAPTATTPTVITGVNDTA